MAIAGKNTFFYFIRSFFHNYALCSAQTFSRIFTPEFPARKRSCFLYDLSGKNFCAEPYGCFLSFFISTAGMAGLGLRFSDSLYQRCCHYVYKTFAVSFYRMVMVRNNSSAGYRDYSGRRLLDGRPLYLSAVNRYYCYAGMGLSVFDQE